MQCPFGSCSSDCRCCFFRGAVMTALSTNPTTISFACEMLERMLSIECKLDDDVQTLGTMLKCAGNIDRFDLVERVWEWGEPMRKHRLDGGDGKDCDIALVYTQFVTLCVQHGHVNRAMEVWNEWCESIVGTTGSTLHSKVLRGAVMTALSTDSTTVSFACEMLERMLSIECKSDDLQTLGAMLKCAGNVNRFDLVERVWEWGKPMRKHRLDGGGGKNFDIDLQYTQFVTICAQHGHVHRALEVWNEWCQSTVGTKENISQRSGSWCCDDSSFNSFNHCFF